mmetsp:Transcript_18970/g.48536  ORF Transcript_18970/g.48536 Transcript_18970/m.48536 type:complete len:89 (-) Transcript_18970:100-366(-)
MRSVRCSKRDIGLLSIGWRPAALGQNSEQGASFAELHVDDEQLYHNDCTENLSEAHRWEVESKHHGMPLIAAVAATIALIYATHCAAI